MEGERDELAAHCQQLELEVQGLRKASEEARHTRSLALEERAKVSVGVSVCMCVCVCQKETKKQ